MIDLVGRCFKDKLATTEWQANKRNDTFLWYAAK
jgi:hypothetical protein